MIRDGGDGGGQRVPSVLSEMPRHTAQREGREGTRRPACAGLPPARAAPDRPARGGKAFHRRETGGAERGVELEAVADPLVVRGTGLEPGAVRRVAEMQHLAREAT